VIFGFLQRGDRDAEKPHEFSRIISPEALGDVGWNGPRGALNLIAESSIHDCRLNGSNRKHPIAQFNRELPGYEIFEAACTHSGNTGTIEAMIRENLSNPSNPSNPSNLSNLSNLSNHSNLSNP
jgi:hypothetical protein